MDCKTEKTIFKYSYQTDPNMLNFGDQQYI